MVEKTFDIALDVKRSTSNREFTVVEGDSGNRLVVTLTDDGTAIDLTGCRVLAVFSTPTGTASQDSAEQDGGVAIGGTGGNVVTIELFLGSFAPGMIECELQVYSGTPMTTLVTTAKFNFTCRRAILNDDTVQQTREHPLLISLLSRTEAVETGLADITSTEAARASAEDIRTAAETQRAEHESARSAAESQRTDVETARASAETARASAEAARISAETAREGAEAARENAETARAGAETARESAETARASAEEQRAANEAIRQSTASLWENATITAATLPAGSSATAQLTESGGAKLISLGIPKGMDGVGAGDMLASEYAASAGVVKDSVRLGGQLPSYYVAANGDASGAKAAFTAAAQRTLPASGGTLSALFGSVVKWLASLGTAAFKAVGTGADDVASGDHTHTAASVGAAVPSVSAEVTLSASGWSASSPYTQTVSVSGMTAAANAVAGLSGTATQAEYEAAAKAKLHITAQSASSITVTAYGQKPSIALPVCVMRVG